MNKEEFEDKFVHRGEEPEKVNEWGWTILAYPSEVWIWIESYARQYAIEQLEKVKEYAGDVLDSEGMVITKLVRVSIVEQAIAQLKDEK